MRPPGEGRRPGEHLDAPQGALAAARAKPRTLGQQKEKALAGLVALRLCLDGLLGLAEGAAAEG
jgi:hypothetical protein